MDFREDDELRELRHTVAAIAGGFGHEYYVARARRGEKATELWKALAEPGFVGVNIPERYGGGGAGIAELAVVCEELAVAGCPLLLLIVSSGIAAGVIARYGTEEQRERWLPAMARGESAMAFAMTESDAGSNTHRIATAARRDGDGYRLRGSKCFISAVDEAEAMLVVARSANGEGLSLFVVDTRADGLSKTPIDIAVTAPETQFLLHLDDVAVPADRLIGRDGDGLRQVFHGLNPERITSAATAVGIARYALERAARYARERSVWGPPIGAHQAVAHPLAEAHIATESAALMTRKAAWLHDTGRDAAVASNMAKFAAAEAALQALDRAIQAHGGNGLAAEYGLADYWGLARLYGIAPVSREMILNHVAEHALALPRSY